MQFNQHVLTCHWRAKNDQSVVDQRVQRVTNDNGTTDQRVAGVFKQL